MKLRIPFFLHCKTLPMLIVLLTSIGAGLIGWRVSGHSLNAAERTAQEASSAMKLNAIDSLKKSSDSLSGSGGTGNAVNNGYPGKFTVPQPTATTVFALNSPSILGQSVTIRASASIFAPLQVLEGSITFKEGNAVLAADVPVSGVTGAAFFTSSSFSVGTHTITAEYNGTANYGPSSQTTTLIVNGFSSTIDDPLHCLAPGDLVWGTTTVTNTTNATQPLTFIAQPAVPGQVVFISSGCNVTGDLSGGCATSPGSFSHSGQLEAGQTATIRYRVQIGDLTAGAQACITSTVTLGNIPPASLTACVTVNCSPVGPGALASSASAVSDQKPGSVLFYNIYTSSTDSNRQNTRINLTNTDPTRPTAVHLFFVDGETCSVADSMVCLTQNQTLTFLMSDFDPGTTGYLLAVAIDGNGCPRSFNYLIGDEYVKFSSGHAANLGAESIAALPGGLGGLVNCDNTSSEAVLLFNGVIYNTVPQTLAADNLPSRADGNDTMVILNRVGGNLATGAATLGTLFGLLYDDSETGISFNVSGGCQTRFSFSNTTPRTAPRFESFIPAGRSGWAKFSSQGNVGIFGAMINFNPNSETLASAFNQGHNLHKLTLNNGMTLTIPVFPPNC